MVVDRGPLIGILGGMGPAATADLYAKVIRCTPAARDQDHLRIVIWADPTVPDRSAALLDGGADPTPHLEHGTRVLLGAGADLIGVACNTAHAFLPEIARRTGARFVHMVEHTAEHVARLSPTVRTVGLMATEGTVHSGIHHEALTAQGLRVVLPDAAGQRSVQDAITSAKRGETGRAVRTDLLDVIDRLAATGAEVVIAGCTELALILDEVTSGEEVPLPWVDPALVLARALVDAATHVA